MFGNKQIVQKKETKEDVKKKNILNEISVLGKKKEEIDNEVKKYSDNKKDREQLKKDIKTLEEKYLTLINEISDKGTSLSKLNTDIDSKNSILSELHDIDGKIIDRKLDINILDIELESIKTLIKLTNNKNKGELKNSQEKLDLIKKSFDSKSSELKEVNKELKLLYSELENAKVKFELILNKYNNDSQEVNLELEQRQLNLDKKNQELEDKNKKIGLVNKEIEKIKKVFDDNCKNENEALNKKNQDIDKREGDIKDREDWLEEKRLKLIKAKRQLEKHYNRKFDNVIL